MFTPVNEALIRKGVGSEIKLFTYMAVREDAMILYGFLDQGALALFKQLIGVNGVGPRSALTILTALSEAQVVSAILTEDKKTLQSVPGVGAKTAGRIILDLKDKVAGMSAPLDGMEQIAAAVETAQGPAKEAVMALTALGYNSQEAARAVNAVTTGRNDLSVEDIIRGCLKLLY
mgnify:CR=1 FL=1